MEIWALDTELFPPYLRLGEEAKNQSKTTVGNDFSFLNLISLFFILLPKTSTPESISF